MEIKNIICSMALVGSTVLTGCSTAPVVKAPLEYSIEMADAMMVRYDSIVHHMDHLDKRASWQYDYALLAEAIGKLEKYTSNPAYGKYMKDFFDYYVDSQGNIRYYKLEEYNLDKIRPAVPLFSLYERTGDSCYIRALHQEIKQLETHPRTKEGGYWHKKIYPHQMWLDGIFMASPFMAEYAKMFEQPQWFDEAVRQITLIYDRTLDARTGLLYHAWDESKTQRWANPETGQSRHFWSRATGWYMMAIADVLDYLPENHSGRNLLISIYGKVASALLSVQDPDSKLWFQVLDCGGREGNYLEASGSSMFIYSFAKGARKGYLDISYLDVAHEAFDSLVSCLMKPDKADGWIMTQICGGCGLGGKPYREGDYHYYVTEKIVENDPKGIAPFILAGMELHDADLVLKR
ncbi:glycoside hydrolase family 88 protein [uncultured Bacteroides sp.]|uniref:glycoside hydrolase family 88/105 protein n=1 Tax=uncultured Bacteroides sp. TaxID=162156 RepID=UPI0025CF5501|nr:glycoside hydrolase family 88 protein [uncultured Bacteroides sp.]